MLNPNKNGGHAVAAASSSVATDGPIYGEAQISSNSAEPDMDYSDPVREDEYATDTDMLDHGGERGGGGGENAAPRLIIGDASYFEMENDLMRAVERQSFLSSRPPPPRSVSSTSIKTPNALYIPSSKADGFQSQGQRGVMNRGDGTAPASVPLNSSQYDLYSEVEPDSPPAITDDIYDVARESDKARGSRADVDGYEIEAETLKVDFTARSPGYHLPKADMESATPYPLALPAELQSPPGNNNKTGHQVVAPSAGAAGATSAPPRPPKSGFLVGSGGGAPPQVVKQPQMPMAASPSGNSVRAQCAGQAWFFNGISRQQAEAMLIQEPPGSFLVRSKPNDDHCILTLRVLDTYSHIEIRAQTTTPSTHWILASFPVTHASIPDLIMHHHSVPIQIIGKSDICLREPARPLVKPSF